MLQSCGMGILPVLILLAGILPAPQENFGYFFIWKSLEELVREFLRIAILKKISQLSKYPSC